MQYVSTIKDTSNKLFCHIWLFSKPRKPFLTSTAPPAPFIMSRLKSFRYMQEKPKKQVKDISTIRPSTLNEFW